MSTGRILASLLGLFVGLGTFLWWFNRYDGELIAVGEGDWLWLGLGLLLMLVAPLIQVFRTAWIMERSAFKLGRPVLVCHGINAVLPAAGDLLEIAWLTRVTGYGLGQVTFRCLMRMVFTISATFVAIGIATGSWVIGGIGLVLPFVIYSLRAWWVPRLGDDVQMSGTWLHPRLILVHMSLALAQLLTEASALWIVVRVGTSQLEFTGALGLRSVVEWTTYVPVPLSGIGFHHAGITESLSLFSQAQQTLAGEAVLHHAVLILSSIVVGCVAWFLMKWPEEMS